MVKCNDDKITFTSLISPSDRLMDKIILLDDSFIGVYPNDILAPSEVWSELFDDLQNPVSERSINGCGSKSTWFVPESMWGLKMTAFCHLHDIMFSLCRTPSDCKFSNMVLLLNMTNHIERHSNKFMMFLRNYRAMTYFSSVKAGKESFCPGYDRRLVDRGK